MNSIEIAKKIIESSGNSFHSRVAQWLQENDWHVLISPYYMDQSQNKAREIDIIAERTVPITDHVGRLEGHVVIRLYIECKFITSHSVFWFTEKDKKAAEQLVCRTGNFRADNMYTKEHHYISTCETVAKVFATEAKSQEQEPFYKALNQVLNAFVSMESRETIIPSLRNYNHGIRVFLNYPVVVCSDFSKLFRTGFFQGTDPSVIEDNFQLEVQYAYTDASRNSRDDHFLIDVVTYEQLGDFCAKLIRNGEVSAFLSEE
jgi:hypothetical protein